MEPSELDAFIGRFGGPREADAATAQSLLVLPSVHGRVVRVFHSLDDWFVANDTTVECLGVRSSHQSPIRNYLERCVAMHNRKGLSQLLADLDPTRVWFFAMYVERPTLLALGTCMCVPDWQTALWITDPSIVPDMDYTLHRYVAPSVPLLPHTLHGLDLVDRVYHTSGLCYTGLFDGVLIVNPSTLFVVRISTPHVVFLNPILRRHEPVDLFLARCAVQTYHMDPMSISDVVSQHWFCNRVPQLVSEHFGGAHGAMIERMYHQSATVYAWLPGWMEFVTTLSMDEWCAVHCQLQRLYMLLDYEAPHRWHRIVSGPRYHCLLAHAVLETAQQACYWDNVSAVQAPATAPSTDDDSE